MRIALVISETPPMLTGVARVAGNLVSGFEAAGHRVDTFSSQNTGRLCFGEVRLTALPFRWPHLRERIEGADVISLHGPLPTFSDVALLLLWRHRRRRPTKLVYTHHFDLRFRWAGVLCGLYNWSQHQLARVADRIIVSTNHLARSMVEAAGEDRVAIIPWGADGPGTIEASRKADRFTILYVGQLRPVKGVDVLIRAACELPCARVIIAGEGPERTRLQRLVHRCQATNVEFFGPAFDDDLRTLYGAAHVVVLPSVRMESFGIVLLEGMAAGCVPVASALPGPTEVIGDAGILCPPGDHRLLARMIAKLGDERERQPLVEKAVARSRKFTWRRTVDCYLDVLDSLLPPDHALATAPQCRRRHESSEGLSLPRRLPR
jgi:rhamnosyl/mannosyltransferase